MIIIRGQETDLNNEVVSATGLSDIRSELCDLPTGIYALEFIPKHEISAWENGSPVPVNRWYGIGVYRDSLTYNQHTEETANGNQTSVEVACLIINDSQAAADQLHVMGNMRFVLRIKHYDGKSRIIGFPDQYCTLVASDYNPAEIIGAQGYSLNFKATFTRRPIVIS